MDSLAKLLFAILFAFSMISCGRTEVSKRLSEIESYINWHPDSALVAVRQIDTLSLRTKAEKAKYSLLHAMALDKNYIDTVDTRIIMPAVDYYGRHGSPADRLKSLMYLGVEQYNAGLYNQAIVSFYQATEYAPKVEDQNLLGILYSRMADTYTMTRDYVQAEEYIDRSLECFQNSHDSDREYRQLYRKAQNLVNIKDWDAAFSCYTELLKTPPTSPALYSSIEANYAMTLLTSSESNTNIALDLFESALTRSGKLNNTNQYGAYAYSLYAEGKRTKCDSVMTTLRSSAGQNDLYYNYWLHRIHLRKGDFRQAYLLLWEAMQLSDSVLNASLISSAANSQRVFLEKDNLNKSLTVKNQRITFLTSILFALLITVLVAMLCGKKIRKDKEENEKKTLLVSSLQDQIKTLEKEKVKAKFYYLSDLYKIIRNSGDDGSDSALQRVYLEIEHKVKTLRDDKNAHIKFEELLNQESDNIMIRFRKDFPSLADNEYLLASYIFAGFDNASLAMILGKSASNTRVLKRRLKNKISSSSVTDKAFYLDFFMFCNGN